MNIILWLVFGALVGWIASAIMKSSNGILGDIAIGIIGSLLGGFLASLFGNSPVTGFNLYSMIVSIIGAVILIWLFRAVRGTSNTSV